MRRDLLDEHVMHGTIGFPVGVYDVLRESEDGVIFNVHYHREFELFIATKGGIRLQLEGETHELEEGQGLFINSGALHSTFAEQREFGFLAIVFSPEFIAAEHEELYEKYIRPMMRGQVSVPVRLDDGAIRLAHEANGYYKAQRPGFELYIKSCLTRIMAELSENAVRMGREEKDARLDAIKDVLDFIHENYAETITLGDMADREHMSREYLCRIFSEVSGQSPIVYLNRYRIMRSAELLREGRRSISETAAKCGFNGSSYYNKLFLRYMKCTPKEYRRLSADESAEK